MKQIKFISPFDGDCVNSRDGEIRDNILYVPVTAEDDEAESMTINSVTANKVGSLFTAMVPLFGWRNKITAIADNGASESMVLFRLKNSEMKFRLSSDDNILFLADLTKNKDVYSSIFENPYLAVYKKAHDLFGAKVHLNLFYSFRPEEAHFEGSREYFDLSMMTDRYRDEFRANSDWLRLAFHAESEYPDKPYKDADFNTVMNDVVKVNREIIRFAGKECLGDSTTVHWGELNRDGARAMRVLGYRSLTGYFEFLNGEPLVAYYADNELTEHVGGRDFWYDSDEDLFFGRIDIILNSHTNEENLSLLKEITSDPHRGGFVSMLIHEQYFYSDYANYIPDFENIVLSACRFVREKEYTGAHITETVAEPHVREYYGETEI